MVTFSTPSSTVSIPITAIQAVEPAGLDKSYIYLKPEYDYLKKSFIFVAETVGYIRNTVNQTIIDANRQIMEEA